VAGVSEAEALRSEIEAFECRSERERASRRRFLAELRRLDRPFDREADLVHVTGSAVVVGARGVVLHRHKRLGLWLQPGGHLDPGETPAQAAWRETKEETGLITHHPEGGPRLFHIDVHQAYAGHIHLDARYLLLASDQDPVPGAGESPDARWFDLQEARLVADPGLIDAIERVVEADEEEAVFHRDR
jgi:8-oxo-dGTP pyrophosphatase MutT (NUDIX family)